VCRAPDAVRRLRLIVEYDSTDYCGWQRQDGLPTIQAELEAAVQRITGEASAVCGAGRTDSGVHALGQAAHLDTRSAISARSLHLGLNSGLPRAISVRSVEDAPPAFDARRSASGKLYRYAIWNDVVRSGFRDRHTWHVREPLDVPRMAAAAAHLVGRHDFAAFRAADCDRATTVRTLRRLAVERADELVTLEVEGDAFLKHMVRILAGTLTAVGAGRLAPDAIPAIRDGGARDRGAVTAPAKGLCLVRVDYAA
jgi:tRNA pseudouridine38-40 synthase